MAFKRLALALTASVAVALQTDKPQHAQIAAHQQLAAQEEQKKHNKKHKHEAKESSEQSKKTSKKASKGINWGDSDCPCIAIHGLSGNATVTINGTKYDNIYPASVGSSCRKWDSSKNGGWPGCDAENPPDFCSQSWCYVDPCNCNIKTNPSPSMGLAGATFEGKQIYYSYATCGGENSFNEPPETKDDIKAMCAEPLSPKYGTKGCPCVGIDGTGGFTTVTMDGKDVDDLYPADVGASCQAWDAHRWLSKGSTCDGSNGTDSELCSQKWCYVDKDNCDVNAYEDKMLTGALFQGKKLYWSSDACAGAPESGAKSFDCLMLLLLSTAWSFVSAHM